MGEYKSWNDMLDDVLPSSWKWLKEVAPEKGEELFRKIDDFEKLMGDDIVVCPLSWKTRFAPFRAVQKPENIRLLVIGQDPYPNKNHAMGLCFSVPDGEPIAPSLRNIFQELKTDLQIERDKTDLTDWAEQGVLLLNQTLTCKEKNSNSHRKLWDGWMKAFWNKFWEKIQHPIAIWCWGNDAKRVLLTMPVEHPHFIHTSVHPSPLSAHRGFFGSRPFSKTNQWLQKQGYKEIIYQTNNLFVGDLEKHDG